MKSPTFKRHPAPDSDVDLDFEKLSVYCRLIINQPQGVLLQILEQVGALPSIYWPFDLILSNPSKTKLRPKADRLCDQLWKLRHTLNKGKYALGIHTC